MKRGLLIFILLSFISCSFCQAGDSLALLRDQYLLKGKRQTTIGLAMAGSGVALILTGAYISLSQPVHHTTGSPNLNFGNVMLLTGEISVLASIPVCIIGEIHRGKAQHLSLAIQKSGAMVQPGRVSSVFQPAVMLSIGLPERRHTAPYGKY